MVQPLFVIHIRKLEEMDFVDEEFLHKKIKTKDVHMWTVVCYKTYSRECM